MLLVGIFAFCAGVIIVLALPMMRGRVRPNGLYGLRTAATFADESVWYEANARSGFELLLLGVLLLVLAVALPFFGLAHAAYGLTWSVVAVIGAVAVAVVGWRRADRLLAERRADKPQPESALHRA